MKNWQWILLVVPILPGTSRLLPPLKPEAEHLGTLYNLNRELGPFHRWKSCNSASNTFTTQAQDPLRHTWDRNTRSPTCYIWFCLSKPRSWCRTNRRALIFQYAADMSPALYHLVSNWIELVGLILQASWYAYPIGPLFPSTSVLFFSHGSWFITGILLNSKWWYCSCSRVLELNASKIIPRIATNRWGGSGTNASRVSIWYSV